MAQWEELPDDLGLTPGTPPTGKRKLPTPTSYAELTHTVAFMRAHTCIHTQKDSSWFFIRGSLLQIKIIKQKTLKFTNKYVFNSIH